MTKPTQLSFEEHEETARLIREFRNALFFEGDIWLSSRYFKKSKITEHCRKLDNVLEDLRSELDSEFCTRFGHLEIYRTSPYYGGGERLPRRTTTNQIFKPEPETGSQPRKGR